MGDEAETGSDQPQNPNKPPKADDHETSEEYHQRYMAWAREEISRLKEEKRAEWEIAFPAVDLDRECAKAAVWLDANPKRRKKRISAFLTGWLSRTQERGGTLARGQPTLSTGGNFGLSAKEQRTINAVNAWMGREDE